MMYIDGKDKCCVILVALLSPLSMLLKETYSKRMCCIWKYWYYLWLYPLHRWLLGTQYTWAIEEMKIWIDFRICYLLSRQESKESQPYCCCLLSVCALVHRSWEWIFTSWNGCVTLHSLYCTLLEYQVNCPWCTWQCQQSRTQGCGALTCLIDGMLASTTISCAGSRYSATYHVRIPQEIALDLLLKNYWVADISSFTSECCWNL